jgi:hypothetical protein
VNCAWTFLTGLARDLDCWTCLLAFADPPVLCKAEPATMHELVYSQPAPLANRARTRWLRFNHDDPNACPIAAARHHLTTCPP